MEADSAHSWASRLGEWSGPNVELTPVLFRWEVAYFVLQLLILVSPCEPCSDLSAILVLTYLNPPPQHLYGRVIVLTESCRTEAV